MRLDEDRWLIEVRRSPDEEAFVVGPRDREAAEDFAKAAKAKHPDWDVKTRRIA